MCSVCKKDIRREHKQEKRGEKFEEMKLVALLKKEQNNMRSKLEQLAAQRRQKTAFDVLANLEKMKQKSSKAAPPAEKSPVIELSVPENAPIAFSSFNKKFQQQVEVQRPVEWPSKEVCEKQIQLRALTENE